MGAWDDLSVPFAQLQLAYSNGVNATANLWIQLWRAVGDQWGAGAGRIACPSGDRRYLGTNNSIGENAHGFLYPPGFFPVGR